MAFRKRRFSRRKRFGKTSRRRSRPMRIGYRM